MEAGIRSVRFSSDSDAFWINFDEFLWLWMIKGRGTLEQVRECTELGDFYVKYQKVSRRENFSPYHLRPKFSIDLWSISVHKETHQVGL